MRIASNKIEDIIRFFRNELNTIYSDGELETLIKYCFEEFTNLKRFDLAQHPTTTVSESELLKFNFAIKELKQHKPIQYIFGRADFYGLKFNVNKHVLIPRPETEELVHLIIIENGKGIIENYTHNKFSILDVGTGSGCIAVTLKKNIQQAAVYAMDIDSQALKIAHSNALLNNTPIDFIEQSILSANVQEKFCNTQFDIIVSNPPYIANKEKNTLEKNVLDYEPHLALFVDDKNPLLFYDAIADFALKHLKKNGKLYVEINQRYGNETLELFKNKGFKNSTLIKDLNNNNRIIKAHL